MNTKTVPIKDSSYDSTIQYTSWYSQLQLQVVRYCIDNDMLFCFILCCDTTAYNISSNYSVCFLPSSSISLFFLPRSILVVELLSSSYCIHSFIWTILYCTVLYCTVRLPYSTSMGLFYFILRTRRESNLNFV